MTSATGTSAVTRSSRHSRRYSPRRVPGTRRLLSKIHHGSPSLIRSVQRSSDGEIDERKLRRCRSDQARGAADRFRESPAPRGCPTAPGDCRCRSSCRWCGRNRTGSGRPDRRWLRARRPLRLRRRQLHRRCKAREARADNVDGARHQMIAYCTAIQDSRSALTLTRVRGGVPAARHHALQHDAIDLFHDPRRFHGAARIARHDRIGLLEMAERARRHRIADLSRARRWSEPPPARS